MLTIISKLILDVYYTNNFQLSFPVIRNAVKHLVLSEIRVPVRKMGVLRYSEDDDLDGCSLRGPCGGPWRTSGQVNKWLCSHQIPVHLIDEP
jgi:hypothetical protein